MTLSIVLGLCVALCKSLLVFIIGKLLTRNRELLGYLGFDRRDDGDRPHLPVSTDGEPESYEKVWLTDVLKDNDPLTRPDIASVISAVGKVLKALAVVYALYSIMSTAVAIAAI